MNELESLELKISKFLRLGVIVAGLLMMIGFIVQFKWNANPFYVFDTYDHIPLINQLKFHYRHQHWGHLSSYLGLIILISLPIIRVMLTGVLFIKQKEYPLAGIAFLVLLGLIISFTFGIEL